MKTRDGLVPIEEIEAGTLVRGRDPMTGQWQWAPVVEPLHNSYDGEIITIDVAGETIECTAGHPFWVAAGEDLYDRPSTIGLEPLVPGGAISGRWVQARDLQEGDMLLTESNGPAKIATVASRQETVPIYNLHVAGVHTYTVGKLAVLVHNTSEPDPCAPRTGLAQARQIARYADDDLAQVALQHRRANGLGRKGNVVVIEYELNGVRTVKTVDSVGQGGRHAEFVARDALPEGATLRRLFTERQPCQVRIPNCDRMLARDFPDADISYLVEYGDAVSRQRGNAALDALLRKKGL